MKPPNPILLLLAALNLAIARGPAADSAAPEGSSSFGPADASCSPSTVPRRAWPPPPDTAPPPHRRVALQGPADVRPSLGIELGALENRLLLHGPANGWLQLERTATLSPDTWSPAAIFRIGNSPVAWSLSRGTALSPDIGTDMFLRLRSVNRTPRLADDFSLIDIDGKRRHLLYHAADTNLHSIVLVFAGEGIPAGDPRLAALVASDAGLPALNYPTFSRQMRALTWLIASSPGTNRIELARQASSRGFGGPTLPVLHDPQNVVAHLYGITTTPSAICIDRASGLIYYRGSLGTDSNLFDLAQALAQHRAPGSVTAPEIVPTGGRPLPPPAPTPDYATDIVPILRAKCITCHRPGTAAPWSMTHHAIIQAYAPQMQQDVLSGHMPPWGGDAEIGRFSNDRSLTRAELEKLVAWLAAGAPRGNGPDPLSEATLEPPPKWPADLGEPDIVLHWPEQKIKALGIEPYRYADVALPTDRPVWIRAAQLRPGNYAVTHHLVASRQRPPGGGIPEIAGYAPGWELQRFPDGTGRRMEAHGVISLEMHYTPNGTPQVDTPELALWLHPTPPAREYVLNWVESRGFRIAPNDPDSTHTAEATLDRSSTIYDFTPHMHLRGAWMRYEALYPNGTSEILLSVPHYDFHWQNTYTLAEPKRVPAGTRLRVTAGFDNSALNLLNPDPNRVVWWGEQSKEEMMIGFFNLTRN